MKQPLNVVNSLFEQWNSNKILYCHWKSNEHLYEGLIGETDLDILVDYSMKEKAEESLTMSGYHKFLPQYGSRYDLVDDWIACDSETGRLIHIHLHYKMITGHKGLKEYDLPWTELALSTRIMHSEFPVYVIDPNLEIIVLVARMSLKATVFKSFKVSIGRYVMSKDDKREMSYLLDLADRDKVYSYLKRYFSSDADELLERIFSKKYSENWYKITSNIIRKHLKSCDRYKPFTMIVRIYYYLVLCARLVLKKKLGIALITRKTCSKGSIIAFVGQDGAGKSTVSDEVVKWLTWKIDAKKYYLGSGEHYHSWQKSLRSKIKRNSGLEGKVKSLLTISDLCHIAKVTYRKMTKAKRYSEKGGIAIFDRYPQMQFEGINDGPKIRYNLKKQKLPTIVRTIALHYASVEEKYINKAIKVQPDLVFKMLLPPEESIRRKPEENLENVKQKHEIIKDLSFDKSEIVPVDATQDFTKELISIHNNIWNCIICENELPVYFKAGS